MKFCKKRKHSYIGLNGIETSFYYILLDDVKEFHGEKFFEKWKELVKNKPLARKDWYYYDDYKFAVLQADSYLNPIS